QRRFAGLPLQRLNNPLALPAQLADRLPQRGIGIVRSPDTCQRRGELGIAQTYQGLQICRKAGCRTSTTEVCANVVITTALRNRLSNARYEHGKYDTAVVVVATQLAQVKIQWQVGIALSKAVGNLR